jgi:transcriptional regulator of heat shock response
MIELTDRQKTLLMLVVRDYIETAQPVGSQRLVTYYRLEMSSATIRNEMAALTEMGYLRQPHTSAGRVPSEDGYRYFVSHMMHQAELPEAIQHTISHQFHQSRPEVEEWMTLAASVLAHQSQAVSLVTAPHAEKSRFKHVELISTQGRQVLMVVAEPEFNASDEARRALRLFDERSTLQDLLSRTVLNSGVGGVQVLIGGEGTWEELRQCSMVLARYGVPGQVTGMLGVLGPMRMSYSKTIPTVRYVAALLSDLVNDTFASENSE